MRQIITVTLTLLSFLLTFLVLCQHNSPSSPMQGGLAAGISQGRAQLRKATAVSGMRRTSKNKTAIQAATAEIERNPNFHQQVSFQVTVLGNFAVDAFSIEEMIDEGVIQTFMKILKQYPNNEALHKKINDIIAKMCINDHIANLIAEAMGKGGNTSHVVHSIDKHMEPETVVSACTAMASLMRTDKNVDAFVAANCIPALASASDRMHSDPSVMASVAACIHAITRVPAHVDAVMATDMVPQLLACLREYPDNKLLAKHVLGLLANIAAAHGGKWIARLRELGALAAISAALDALSHDPVIVKLGALALSRISNASDLDGALPADFAVTPEYAAAVSRLAALMLVNDHVVAFVGKNGHLRLAAALKSAAAAPASALAYSIMASLARAVERISSNRQNADPEVLRSFLKQGCGQSLLDIIRRHGAADDGVLYAALMALARLVQPFTAQFFVDAGVLSVFAEVLAKRRGARDIVYALSYNYERFSRHTGVHPPLIAAGIVRTAVELLREYKKDREIVLLLTATLANFAMSPEGRRALVEAGALELLAELLSEWKDDVQVLNNLFAALNALTSGDADPAVLKRLQDAGVLKRLTEVAAAHPNNPDMQKWCAVLAANINGASQDPVAQAIRAVNDAAAAVARAPHAAATTAPALASAVSALAAMALSKGVLEAMANGGASAALVNAVKAGLSLSAEAHAQDRGDLFAGALRGLLPLRNAPGARVYADCMNGGIVAPLLHAVAADPSDERLAENAMKLAERTLGASKDFVVPLVSAGIVQGALGVLKPFVHNNDIRANADSIFATALGSSDVVPPAVAKKVAAECAPGVAELIDEISSDVGLLEACYPFAATVACHKDGAAALLAAGFGETSGAVLAAHVDTARVPTMALATLCNFHPTLAGAIGNTAAATATAHALVRRLDDRAVTHPAAMLLSTLAKVAENAVRMNAPGQPYRPALEAAKKSSHRETARLALETLQALDACKPDILLKTQEERMAFLKGLLSSKPEKVQTHLQMLRDIMESYPEDFAALVQDGLLQFLATAMVKNADNEALFKELTDVFQKACGPYSNDTLERLMTDDCRAAQCQVILPHDNFKAPVSDAHLRKNLEGMAELPYERKHFDEFSRNGAMKALSKIITTHHDSDTIAYAAKVLGRLSNLDDDPATTIANSGFNSIRELIDAIRKNIANGEFVRCGMHILGNFCVDPNLKEEIGVESGVNLIAEVLRKHAEARDVLEAALYTLSQVTFDSPTNCAFALATKAARQTMDIMTSSQANMYILESALFFLTYVCACSDANKLQLAQAGAADAIASTILKFLDKPGVLHQAFGTLLQLASSPAGVDCVIKAGGVQCCIAGISSHPKDASVVDAAVRTLTALASSTNADHLHAMVEHGAAQALMEVAQSNCAAPGASSSGESINNIDLATTAVRGLFCLSVLTDIADAIIKLGGVDVISRLLAAFGYEPKFVDLALRLVFNLTFSFNNLQRLATATVARQLARTVMQHSTVPAVVTIGLQIVSNLCYTDRASSVVGGEGPIESCFSLLSANLPSKASPEIAAQCFRTLSALCRAEGNALAMTESALAWAAYALQAAPDASMVVAVGAFLANLFVHAPVAVAAAEKDNFITVILEAVNAHAQTPDVVMTAVKPLENMAYANQPVRDTMKACQVIESMEHFKQLNGDREDVCDALQAVINAVNRTDFAFSDLALSSFDRTPNKFLNLVDLRDKKSHIPDELPEIPPKIKNFLTAGALLLKHSRTAKPRQRHVYVTEDMKWLIWKDPKAKVVDEETRMKVFAIRTVERGRVTEQLQRKSFGGKFLANDRCCFSILGRERSVDLETSNEQDRDMWILAIEALIAHRKSIQALRGKPQEQN
jgi:hypothetical protein